MSAISALKGFRTQFLYSLHHILTDSDPSTKFRLEGVEDLDILDSNDNILKVIQVKNLNTPLVLSDIHTQKQTKTSFLKRYLDTKKTYPNVEPIVISFGGIGDELKNLKSSTSKKNKSSLFKEEEWTDIKQKVIFLEVEENTLERETLALLKQKFPSIDPEPTFEILQRWLSCVAEKQQVVTNRHVFDKVESIAKYLSDRIAVTAQYGVHTTPLHLEDYSNINHESLKEEFYNGVNARYAHIVYNLDVERPELVKEINAGFKNSNIVVLQGASGQGKSTLAYRYAFANAPSSLIYELNIQENPEKSREAIRSVKAMTSSLETPVLFLIHVAPNSTEWIKIVKEFSVDALTHFLVTIRQEDWYKAQSYGIKFLYKEIELELLKNEAFEIYRKLNEKHLDLVHLDFEEAWIKFGERGPLLEFVYAVTKGESLEKTLKQQLSVLENETQTSNHELLTLLRIVCLADAYGARVSAEKIKGLDNIPESIKRLEKEYLVKLTEDKKYIAGLHPQRSKVLLKNLFDEFVLEKKEFALANINVIEEKNIYYYLLHLFQEAHLAPDKLITRLEGNQTLSWAFYYETFRGLLWIGIDEYLKENENLLKLAYEQLGDAWSFLIDLYFGETSSAISALDNLDIADSFKKFAVEINQQLSPKDNVFKYAKALLTKVSLPTVTPQNSQDWSSYGQLAFWTDNLNRENKSQMSLAKEDYGKAFELLDVNSLASLMFGMTWLGQSILDLKHEYSNLFTEKIRIKYNVPQLVITQDEVFANYIIDITQNDEGKDKALNERSMEILSLLRKAFPEKSKYSAQGYGHRLALVPLPHDDTHKTIPVENLPLEEWVEINSIVRKRFEYSILPIDWEEFHKRLDLWESTIKDILNRFSESFTAFYGGNREYKCLTSLVDNVGYQNPVSLKLPQSITDPFGTSYNKIARQFQKSQESSSIETKLHSKYKSFFKSYGDFRYSIELFVRQSAETLYHNLKKVMEPEHALDENIQRLSQRNLFEAIKYLPIYEAEKGKHFGKFIGNGESTISKKQLLATAFVWKQFLANRFDKQNNVSQKAIAHINSLQQDFESRIAKNCKVRSQKGNFILKYQNNAFSQYKPVVIMEVEEPIWILIGLKEAFEAIKNAVGQPEYTSLKYLVLETSFEEFSILPLIKSKTLNEQWYQLPLYAFHDYEFENLGIHHWVGKPINEEIIVNLQLLDWVTLISKISETRYFVEQFMKIPILNQHLLDLKELLEKDIDPIGENMLTSHFQKKMEELQTSFQYVLDYLANILSSFPFEEQLYISNEYDKEYWDCLMVIKDNIFPTKKGDEEDYQAKIDLEVMQKWSERLQVCTGQIGLFNLLLCGKHIKVMTQNVG